MRTLAIGFTLFLSTVAAAKAATPVAADQKEDIRLLGRLNINDATREQLLTLPGLDEQTVDAIVLNRQTLRINDLDALQLPPEAVEHLKIDGPSDYRRIRRLPLEMVAHTGGPKTASR